MRCRLSKARWPRADVQNTKWYCAKQRSASTICWWPFNFCDFVLQLYRLFCHCRIEGLYCNIVIVIMLISVDEDDQMEIARQVYRMAKARQRHRFNNFQRGSIVGDNLPALQKHQDGVKLPTIRVKADKSQQKQSPQTKRQFKKKSVEGNKLMQLIKKQISIEKRSYFQTISSDKALIIKNTPRSNELPKEKKKAKQKKMKINITEGQIQQPITPPLKIFREKKTSVDTHLPKNTKKQIKNRGWEEEYTPWFIGGKQSEEIAF